MAEARSISTLHDGLTMNSSALKFFDEDEGITLSITIPRPGVVKRNCTRRIHRGKNSLINSFFPLGWMLGVGVMALIIGNVLLRGPDSWWRSGVVAEAVWDVCLYIPFFMSLPRYGRISVAAALAGLFLAVCLAMIQRYILRTLLQWHGWLYLDRGGDRTPFYVKLWFFAVKLLNGSRPLTYSFQGSLPHLPVPAIEHTLARYLETVRPLQTADQFEKTKQMAEEFRNNEARKIQRWLVLKSWWAHNYVSDWWEAFVYLRGRSPIMVNSNYYCLDMAFVFPTRCREARAGMIVHEVMKYKKLLDQERVKPIMIRNLVPMCMDQYRRTFSTNRIPGKETDVVKHWENADSRHLMVMHRGTYWSLNVFHKDGRLLSPWELEDQFTLIVQAVAQGPKPRPGEEHIAALTAWNRTRWAEAREIHFAEGTNRTSLDLVERSIMTVCLDDSSPEDWSAQGKACLHGTGSDRWFDKSVNLIFFKNGRCGVNAEHSWADALVVGHMWEHSVNTGEHRSTGYDPNGHVSRPADALPLADVKFKGRRLPWDLSEVAVATIENAHVAATELLNDLDLQIFPQEKYGKGFIKKCRLSPDSYVQMVLQLAWYRDQGKFSLSYEASSTRLFRHGRTETVRPVSDFSCAFVRAMEDKNATNEERREFLSKAVTWHSEYARDAMCGRGVDRHLFALYVVSVGKNIESPFLKEAISQNWMLSTSQQPQCQTDRWDPSKNPEDAKRICSGGGFGPVADDGYGVSYMLATEEIIFFHVSSKVSSPNTDSRRFKERILQAFVDVAAIFDKPAAKPAKDAPKVAAAPETAPAGPSAAEQNGQKGSAKAKKGGKAQK